MLTYEMVKQGVAEDYKEFEGEECLPTFYEVTMFILSNFIECIYATEARNLMAYVALALAGLERGELIDKIREGALAIIREDRLTKLRREFSAGDFKAIREDLEKIKAQLAPELVIASERCTVGCWQRVLGKRRHL